MVYSGKICWCTVDCKCRQNGRNGCRHQPSCCKIQLKRENQIYRESIISISHDIRTPLTSAKGYLQMLQKGSVPQEKELEYIQIIEQRLDHVAELCYFLIQF